MPLAKTTLRHFNTRKLYTAINIIGLTVGVTCMLLAVMYWNAERSFDTFHTKSSQLFRVTTTLKERSNAPAMTTGGTGQVQGPAFKAAVPEVSEYVRILGGDIYGDVRYEETALRLQMVFADSNFLDVFSFPLLSGDRATAMNEMNKVVISEETAIKFFHTTDAIGKLLYLDADPSADRLGNKPMMVTGVSKHLPANSSIQFDILLPFRFLQLSFNDENWLNAYLGTFVVLSPGADQHAVTKKFDEVYSTYANDQLKKAEFNPDIKYGLQPITEIHLNSLLTYKGSNEGGTVNESRAIYSNLFLGIAFFILLLASINFVNINIAGSLDRAREVCIRKINGSSRAKIFLQFLSESAVLCLFAFILAAVLTKAFLPLFGRITGMDAVHINVFTANQIAGFAGVFVLNILLSGLYPAFLLSAFKPVEVLYNRNQQIGLMGLSKVMVIGQFALAFFLILTTIVYYLQMNFIRTKNLGFQPSYVVRTNINGNRNYEAIKELIKNEVTKYPFFEGISFGGEFGNSTPDTKVGQQHIFSSYQSIDDQYLNVMGIALQSGTNLSPGLSHQVLVNEAFIKESNLQDPIGTRVELDRDFSIDSLPYHIAGVVSDFHFRSLHHAITPIVLYPLPRNSGGIWLKINRNHTAEALKTFERIYHSILPGAVYRYEFLNDLATQEYEKEQRWQKIISLAAILALLISSMGLSGLAHLNTRQRVKEIGIRKVLGASVQNIVNLLTSDFLKLVLTGIFIAVIAAFYFTNYWLMNFAYRVEIHWWMYFIAGVGVVLISVLTVIAQAVSAGMRNPVDALRNE